MTAYRTRFQLDENLTDFSKASARDLQPGSYIKLTLSKFGPRTGRAEPECIVREFKVSNPEWTWMGHLSQFDRDLRFLRQGPDVYDLFEALEDLLVSEKNH